MIAAVFLLVLAIYLGAGLLFAVAFVLFGVKQIDPHAMRGSWGFRMLIIPGTTALWPLLLRRWVSGFKEPPAEGTPHRRAARVTP
jgi:membrane protein implicated in regulation of membrane protease activity